MGAKQSKSKEDDDQRLKLPNILDHIATKYITTSNFKDLENLHDVNYCNKLVILTSKVIKNNLHLLDIDYQEQRMEHGNEVNKMTKDRIIYLNKESIDDIDVQSDLKKKEDVYWYSSILCPNRSYICCYFKNSKPKLFIHRFNRRIT